MEKTNLLEVLYMYFFWNVRTQERYGVTYFDAQDVCRRLGLTHHRSAVRRISPEHKDYVEIPSQYGTLRKVAVDIIGLYQILKRTKSPVADELLTSCKLFCNGCQPKCPFGYKDIPDLGKEDLLYNTTRNDLAMINDFRKFL